MKWKYAQLNEAIVFMCLCFVRNYFLVFKLLHKTCMALFPYSFMLFRAKAAACCAVMSRSVRAAAPVMAHTHQRLRRLIDRLEHNAMSTPNEARNCYAKLIYIRCAFYFVLSGCQFASVLLLTVVTASRLLFDRFLRFACSFALEFNRVLALNFTTLRLVCAFLFLSLRWVTPFRAQTKIILPGENRASARLNHTWKSINSWDFLLFGSSSEELSLDYIDLFACLCREKKWCEECSHRVFHLPWGGMSPVASRSSWTEQKRIPKCG